MTAILKYFQLDDYEVNMYRFWAVLFLVFIPVYGLILLHFLPDSVDSMLLRYLISAYWSSLLAFSYISPRKAKKYMGILSYIGYFGVMAWLIWLVHLNHYLPDYTVGLYLCISGIAIINRSILEMTIFYLFCLILILITFHISPDVHINKPLFILSILILSLVHSSIIIRREYINRNLKRSNRSLSLKNERMRQILYATSHDLKTPLRTISSFATLLTIKSEDEADEETKQFTDVIRKGVQRMDKVLDDFVDYSSYDSDGTMKWEEINLPAVIDEIIQRLASDEGVACARTPHLPETIKGDGRQIRQLFERLIENGLKYNTSSLKKVDIQYQSEWEYHVFSIQDNGIGIAPRYKDKVFSLFQRLHSVDEFEGNGVGLAICKSVVENHKGEIWFEPAESGGTIFYIKLAKKLN